MVDRLIAICEWISNSLGVSPQAATSILVLISAGLGSITVVLLLKKASCSVSYQGKSEKFLVVTFLVVAYSLCSSMLLVLNKVAVTHIPAPSSILLCQLASCTLFVKISANAGMLEAEPLQSEKAQKFLLIVFGFIGALYSNVTSLQYVPVDTMICFRASCPVILAILDFLYLGRELPCLRSWASLIGVFAGVAAYAWHDVHFTTLGYVWISIWYIFAVFEVIYVKKVVDTVEMTTWSRTYYQNTLAILPMLAITGFSGEVQTLLSLNWTARGVAALLASCAGGLGMSYFSFALRAVISATSFSIIGNGCKVLTVLVNLLMWDQHSSESVSWGIILAPLVDCVSVFVEAGITQRSTDYTIAGLLSVPLHMDILHVCFYRLNVLLADAIGTAALLGCLGAGAAYKQAPMRRAHLVDKAQKTEQEEPLMGKAEHEV